MNVFLSSPVYSHCHPDFVDAYIETIETMREGMGWTVYRHPFGRSKGSAQLNLVRSAITEHFLKSGCDVMVQVDADQWWKPVDMIALVRAIELDRTDIAGAAVAIKDESCKPNVQLPNSIVQRKEIRGCFRFPLTGFIGEDPRSHASPLFVPIDRIGGGMLAVSRKCAQFVSDGCADNTRTPTTSGVTPVVFDWSKVDGVFESEDYTFVHRAIALGFRAHALATARIHHIGERVFVAKLDEALMRAHIEVRCDSHD